MSRRYAELAWMALGAALVACLLAAPALAPQSPMDGDPSEEISRPSESTSSGGPYVEMLTLLCKQPLDGESEKP